MNGKSNRDGLNLKIEIPVNTTAKVYFPVGDAGKITENGKSLKTNKDIEFISLTADKTICKVGSGKYSFYTNIQ